jgi:hypothetical protein
MKGFIGLAVAQVPAFLAADLPFAVHFAFSYDEEVGGFGAQRLIADLRAQGVLPLACIVGRADRDGAGAGAQGRVPLALLRQGRAAHSSLTPKSVNAIEVGARVVGKLTDMAERWRDGAERYEGFDVPYSTGSVGGHRGRHRRQRRARGLPLQLRVPQPARHRRARRCRARCAPMPSRSSRRCAPSRPRPASASRRSAPCRRSWPAPTTRRSCWRAAWSMPRPTTLVAFGTKRACSRRPAFPPVVLRPAAHRAGAPGDEYVALDQLAAAERFLQALMATPAKHWSIGGNRRRGPESVETSRRRDARHRRPSASRPPSSQRPRPANSHVARLCRRHRNARLRATHTHMNHHFPSPFLWGAATSAYQIEGSPLADGAGPSIWHRFVRTPGLVANGDTGDVACDHYRRMKDDVAMMKRLGLTAYRFSIAWGRVLPEGRGAVNEGGLGFYERLVDTLLENGIQPMATLFHWDLPAALDDRGGWLNPDVADWFADYASVMYRRLDGRVKLWATLNEPWVVTDGGYLHGPLAPGHKNKFERRSPRTTCFDRTPKRCRPTARRAGTRSGSSSTSSRSTRPRRRRRTWPRRAGPRPT